MHLSNGDEYTCVGLTVVFTSGATLYNAFRFPRGVSGDQNVGSWSWRCSWRNTKRRIWFPPYRVLGLVVS